MTRYAFCERVRRLIYGGIPNDDAEITVGLVNNYLLDAIGMAVKTNYGEALKIDGIGYINNSFYATFSNMAIAKSTEDLFDYYATLPQIPFAIGRNEGIASAKVYSSINNQSIDLTPLSENELSYMDKLPQFDVVYYWNEGKTIKIRTPILLYPDYKIRVRMVSGGDSTNMNSELNIPDEYYPIMTDYIMKMLGFERAQVQDLSNDGVDAK